MYVSHLKQCLAQSKHNVNVSYYYYYYGVKSSGKPSRELETLVSTQALNQGSMVEVPVNPSVLYIAVKGKVWH